MQLLLVEILAPVITLVLVFVVLLLVIGMRNRVAAVQRQQVKEFAQLRKAIAELRRSSPGEERDEQAAELPTIGTSARVLQIGEQVEINDGPHAGKLGKVVPSPEWVREGVINVELTGVDGPRFVEVSKVRRWNESGRE